MNTDQIKGNWKQIKGIFKAKWGELTEDEYVESEGELEFLAGKIQERYGKTKDQAMEEINTFIKSLK